MVVAATGTVAAQQPAGRMLRARVEVVTVDAIVTDRRGVPVADVTVEEFEVDEDPQRVDLAGVEFVSAPDAEPANVVAPDGPGASGVADASNAERAPGRYSA